MQSSLEVSSGQSVVRMAKYFSSVSPPVGLIILTIMSNKRNEIIQPSSPGGDYMEKDIQQIWKGKAVISLRLIPDGGVLSLFQASEDKTHFVSSKKWHQVVILLFEIAVASFASQQQKICCSAEIKININANNKGQGGAPNISTLRAAHSNIHFPEIARIVTSSLLVGQKKLQCFFPKKIDAVSVNARSNDASFVGTLSTQCSTVSEVTHKVLYQKGIQLKLSITTRSSHALE
jgi:hypothetical protein